MMIGFPSIVHMRRPTLDCKEKPIKASQKRGPLHCNHGHKNQEIETKRKFPFLPYNNRTFQQKNTNGQLCNLQLGFIKGRNNAKLDFVVEPCYCTLPTQLGIPMYKE